MAARETAKYGAAAVAISLVIIAGAIGFMSLAPTSLQTPSTQATTQTTSRSLTTIQLGSSIAETATQSSSAKGPGNNGILSIYLKDAPSSNPNLKYLLINVSSVELAYAGNNATGTILMVSPSVGTNLNISSLQGQSLPLGRANLPAGSITSTSLHITGARAFYTDGSTEQLQVVANGKLMIPIQFGLVPNGSTDLTIDITPSSANISAQGVLTPVIHAVALEKIPNGSTTQTVTVTESSLSTETTTQSVTLLVTVTRTLTTPSTITTTTTQTQTVTTPTTSTATSTLTSVTTSTKTTTTTTGIVVTQTVTSTTTLPPTTTTSTATVTSPTTTTQTVTTTTTATPTATTTTTSTVTLPPTTTTTTATTTQTSTATVTSPTTTTSTVTSTTTLPPTTTTSTTTQTSTTTKTSTTTVTSPTTTTKTVTSTTTVTVTTTTKNPDGSHNAIGASFGLVPAGSHAVSPIVPALAMGLLLITGAAVLALPRLRRNLTT